ncbi:MAG: HU family DNA-binding protein [Azonexus sp.]
MNQSELIAKTAAISGLAKKDVEHVLKTAADVIAAELAEGGEVTLPGLGKLGVSQRQARAGRNPKTGEPLAIPARRVPHFAAAKVLKDAVAG